MHHMHSDEGKTLEEVGIEFGVTRERVRQLLGAAGYSTRTRGDAQRLRRLRERAA